jgi:hypothetical protein
MKYGWNFWLTVKVIYPKYSKHWPYTVASTIDYGCSKMLNHGLNHVFFFTFQAYRIECQKVSFFDHIPQWKMYVGKPKKYEKYIF